MIIFESRRVPRRKCPPATKSFLKGDVAAYRKVCQTTFIFPPESAGAINFLCPAFEGILRFGNARLRCLFLLVFETYLSSLLDHILLVTNVRLHQSKELILLTSTSFLNFSRRDMSLISGLPCQQSLFHSLPSRANSQNYYY